MLKKIVFALFIIVGVAFAGSAEDAGESTPVELEVLKSYVGVWDAEIEVWPQGLDSPSITFQGVETIRPYGEHWLASDFDSEFMGETVTVHSIVGYDLDKKKMVGTIIDHGPYSASMTGDYDAETMTVAWMVEAKHPNGTPMVQKSLITQKTADERVLVMFMPSGPDGEFTKFMEVIYVKRP